MRNVGKEAAGICDAAIEFSAQAMTAWVDGVEWLYRAQNQAATRWWRQQTELLELLVQADSPEKIWALPTRWGQTQLNQSVALYGQLLTGNSQEQQEYLRQSRAQALEMADGLRKSLENLAEAGADPVIQAIRMAAEAAQQSCAATLKLADSAPRRGISATHKSAPASNGPVRKAA